MRPGRLLGAASSEWPLAGHWARSAAHGGGLGFLTLPSQVPLGGTSHWHVLMPWGHSEKDGGSRALPGPAAGSQRPHHLGHSLSCCALFKETVVMCSGDTSQRVPVATVGQARPGVRENGEGGARIPLLSDLTSSVSGTAGTAGDTVLQNHEASTRLREAASAAGFKGGRLARV